MFMRETNKLNLGIVRQRIVPSQYSKTTPEIFNREADLLAKHMVNNLGMEIIGKMQYFADYKHFPFCEYVA